MISFNNISKAFGAQQILKNATFSTTVGEHIGIVGPNGSGKSTVLALLTGEISPDSGNISTPKGYRIGFLHQQLHTGNIDDTVLEYAEGGIPELTSIQRKTLTIEDKLSKGVDQSEKEELLDKLGTLQTRFEHLNGYSIRNRAETGLCGLGFSTNDFEKPFKEFSGGWQMRADLVRTLVSDPDILLLDEPSNYLDIPAIEWLQRFLRDYKGTMILISHDRYLLNSLTSTTIEIANYAATRYAGNYDYYAKERILRQEHAESAIKNQNKKREHAEQFIERFRAKNTKAAAVQSRIKMLKRMETTELPVVATNKVRINIPTPGRSGHEIVRLENVGVTYDGTRWVLKGVDLRIERENKTALIGLNGLGKTTLLRVLAGRLPPSEGKRFVGHNVLTGYQSQEFAETMDESQSIYDTVRNSKGMASDQQVRSLLGSFGFRGKDIDKTVKVLSGGEKVRLAFAKMLINPPNFMLLDEPTTHLDIAARETLEDALKSFKGTVCIVSHDIEFVKNVATEIIAMDPPGIKKYSGGYNYYHEKLQNQVKPETNSKTQIKSIGPRKTERKERAQVIQKYSKIRRSLQKEINQIEKRINQFEAEREKLLTEMQNENVDYKDLNSKLAATQQKLNDYNSRWEAFAIELDELDCEYAAQRKQSTDT